MHPVAISGASLSFVFYDYCILTKLPNVKSLYLPKFIAIADDRINVTETLTFVLGREENIIGKRRKIWLPAFSLFPTMFSKGFFFQVIKSHNFVVKIEFAFNNNEVSEIIIFQINVYIQVVELRKKGTDNPK